MSSYECSSNHEGELITPPAKHFKLGREMNSFYQNKRKAYFPTQSQHTSQGTQFDFQVKDSWSSPAWHYFPAKPNLIRNQHSNPKNSSLSQSNSCTAKYIYRNCRARLGYKWGPDQSLSSGKSCTCLVVYINLTTTNCKLSLSVLPGRMRQSICNWS